MKLETQKKLIQINSQFYQKAGKYFDNSRNYAWKGWEKLIYNLQFTIFKKNKIKVLDIGCGNSRFGEFLVENLRGVDIDYTGVDSSRYLLDSAEKKISKIKSKNNSLKYNLVNIDIVFDDLEKNVGSDKYDLVVLFGVMHHIPSFDNRKNLIRKSSNLLSDKGLVVFTVWKFMDSERLIRRVVNPDIANGLEIFKKLNISKKDLEVGDFILDWRRGVTDYRYCHHLNDEEVSKIIDDIKGVDIVDSYMADGKEGNVNAYYVLSKKL